ncbi:unnamed protein product, partial [Hapterophycus canaliculatus]
RDLTPPNVFLDGEENVKLGDFGLATSKKVRAKTFADSRHKLSLSGDTSQLTDGVGTGPYIAPEQGARFGQYNHKADMWSLGVILFEMLAPRSVRLFSLFLSKKESSTTREG